jgi:hypothetical protein
MNQESGKTKYVLLGFIVFVAVLFYYQSLKLPKAGYQLPRLLSGIILVLVLIDIAGAFLHRISKTVETEKKNPQKAKGKKFFFFLALTAMYIFFIQPIGYFIMTPLYLFIVFSVLRSMKLSTTIIVAVGFTLFVCMLFVKFLNLPVLMGFLG